MYRNKIFVLTTTLGLAATPVGAMEGPIGYVKTVSGDALVVDGGKAIPARPGAALQIGTVLKTGKAAGMGVTFKDNTTLSLGPDTQVTVDEYLYAPSKGSLKLGASMNKGSLHYVSGVIAKLRPEAVALKTPTGIIGVRGTRFVVKVVGEDEK